MYYYDSKVNECYPFIYGGCGGNLNRFATEGSCLGRCRYILGKRDLPLLTPIVMPIAKPVAKPVPKPFVMPAGSVTWQGRPAKTLHKMPVIRPVAKPVTRPITRPRVVYNPRRTSSQLRPIASSRKGQRDFGLWNSLFRLGWEINILMRYYKCGSKYLWGTFLENKTFTKVD